MTSVYATSMEANVRLLAPMATILFAGLLDLAPMPNAGIASHAPDLILTAVFFWSLHRPELLPPTALFATGLCVDLVGGSLIGITPAILLLVRQAVVRQHRLLLAASPFVLWLGFASYAAGSAFLRWVAASGLAWHWQSPPVSPLLLTVLFWPLVQMLLAHVRTILPKVRHAAGS